MASDTISSLNFQYPVNFMTLFHKEVTSDSWSHLEASKYYSKIGILLSFTNFRAIVVQFGFKKMKFGDLQSSLEWPLTELLLVRSIQLVNMHMKIA